MWSALRTDLREFVSTVAEESTNALTVLDSNLSRSDNEQSEVIPHEDGNVTYLSKSSVEDIDEQKKEEEEQFILNLEQDLRTYTEELTEQEQGLINVNGLSTMDKEAILEKKLHVKEIYGRIVNSKNESEEVTLTEEDFWLRYYVRCYRHFNLDEGEQSGEDEESPGNQVISGIFKFMEGAARQLDDMQRPPFVLNTAVDEEEDEELAWESDDDEDEVEEEQEIENGGKNEQETEQKYDDKCKQLEEERDALHQTVELQRDEIADLHLMLSELKDKIKIQDSLLKQHNIDPEEFKLQEEPSKLPSTSTTEDNVDSSEKSSSNVDVTPSKLTSEVPKEPEKNVEEDNSEKVVEEDDWGDDAW